jgi:hypothetical protein
MIKKPVSVMIIDAVPTDIYGDRPNCPGLVECGVDNDKKVFVVAAGHAEFPCLASGPVSLGLKLEQSIRLPDSIIIAEQCRDNKSATRRMQN